MDAEQKLTKWQLNQINQVYDLNRLFSSSVHFWKRENKEENKINVIASGGFDFKGLKNDFFIFNTG